MKVAIRVDANSKIGLGHFIRSFAFSQELSEQGLEVVFFTNKLTERVQNRPSSHEIHLSYYRHSPTRGPTPMPDRDARAPDHPNAPRRSTCWRYCRRVAGSRIRRDSDPGRTPTSCSLLVH